MTAVVGGVLGERHVQLVALLGVIEIGFRLAGDAVDAVDSSIVRFHCRGSSSAKCRRLFSFWFGHCC